MQALIRACEDPLYPARVGCVISDRPDAQGLQFASQHNIPSLPLDRSTFAGRKPFEAALEEAIQHHQCEMICLAGFMRILSSAFVARWHKRIINIHPSLLPNYKGLNTHQRALDNGETLHGCTVHHVVAGVDEGPIIAQDQLNIITGENADQLAARVLELENRLYPAALRRVLEHEK